MCGIAGFTFSPSTSCDEAETILSKMLKAMSYRGPDQSGVKCKDGVAFGHNRLSIVGLDGGRQPIVGDDLSPCILTYNGEIYNFKAFDREIIEQGYRVNDSSDTDRLFSLLKIYGVERTLQKIDGMYAFAYWDSQEHALYLVRDRMGQKPVYYAERDGQLIFASEMNALLKHPLLNSFSVDREALSLYMMLEYIPGEATAYKGIFKLPPGSVLRYKNSIVNIDTYWSLRDYRESPELGNLDDIVDELDLDIQQAVSQQLAADVPVGVFLSGGLDSSLIAAVARKQRDNISSFTVRFPEGSFDESRAAESLASKLNIKHTTICLNKSDYVSGLESLLENMDQPFADSSFLPTYLLCRETRKHVKVAIGGDGADEIFYGYPNFKALKYSGLASFIPASLGEWLRELLRLVPPGYSYMNIWFLLRQFSLGFGKNPELQNLAWMSAVSEYEQIKLLKNGSPVFSELLSEMQSHSSSSSVFEKCKNYFTSYYLPDDILYKTDRASMYNSLEVRAPYLSRSIVEKGLRRSNQLNFKAQKGKRVLREVAKRYLPETILNRSKHGFALPVSTLLKNDIRDIVSSKLIDRSNPVFEFLNFELVHARWNQHQKGKADWGKYLWAIFILSVYFGNKPG